MAYALFIDSLKFTNCDIIDHLSIQLLPVLRAPSDSFFGGDTRVLSKQCWSHLAHELEEWCQWPLWLLYAQLLLGWLACCVAAWLDWVEPVCPETIIITNGNSYKTWLGHCNQPLCCKFNKQKHSNKYECGATYSYIVYVNISHFQALAKRRHGGQLLPLENK